MTNYEVMMESRKNDMLVRLHYLHCDIWKSLDDPYSIKASEMYRTMMLTNKLILRSVQRYNRSNPV